MKYWEMGFFPLAEEFMHLGRPKNGFKTVIAVMIFAWKTSPTIVVT